MLHLIAILTPIALIDSFTPVRFTILSSLLGTTRPVKMAYAFIFGIFFGYLAIGSLILFGLDAFIKKWGDAIASEWNAPITIWDIIFQLIIGLLMIFFAYRAARPKNKVSEEANREGLHPAYIFLLGFVPAFTPTPGMLPYFASIDQILQANLSRPQMFTMLLYYNIIFLVPPSVLVIVRVVSEDYSRKIFAAITNFFATWGKGFIITVLILLGILLVADAVGLYFGRPILPVAEGQLPPP
ncbi:MAG: GAP family protein [Verrucomicrobiota bacterium]